MFSQKLLTSGLRQEMNRQVSRLLNQKRFKASAVSATPTEEAGTAEVSSAGARPWEEIPGPRSLPFIGTMWMFMPGGPLYGLTWYERFIRMQELWGNLIREEPLPGYQVLHLFDPRDMEAVYRAEGRLPIRDSFHMLRLYNKKYNDGIQGLITSQGEDWYRMRSAVQHKMLKPRAVTAYLQAQEGVATDFVSRVKQLRDQSGDIEDVTHHLYRFAMEAIGVVCFNKRVGALEAHIDKDSDTWRFIQSVEDVFSATQTEMTSFLFHYFETPTFKRLIRAQNFIKEITWRQAVEGLESVAGGQAIDGEHGDLIPYLLTRTHLSRHEAMTLVAEFFFAGVDTTSHLLGYTLYALAKFPEKQERLIAEIDEVLPDHSTPDVAALSRMPYLRAVLKESLRYIPVAPGNARTLTKETVINGYSIPAKTLAAMHHDVAQKKEEHFEQPLEFQPERWLRAETKRNFHPFTYMPFGFGPRSCPGKRLAEQEVSLALIKLFQHFTVEYRHHEDLRYEMCIVNAPVTPLKFRFADRK